MYNQNNIERIMDQLNLGKITTAEANVQIVRMERVRIITKLHRDVRNALNAAVKSGELGHMKKEGLAPEVYYHPDFKYLANEARNKAFQQGVESLKAVRV